ncbi:MAG: hypothetical protein PSX36_03850 [bacterium]|nr:hypothetical protein [bacterium]
MRTGKIINTALLAFVLGLFSFQTSSFKNAQLKNSRVKVAYQQKWPGLKHLLETKGIPEGELDLFLRIFKKEGVLEAWGKRHRDKDYGLLKSFAICSRSGVLGPKRRQGDYQVPEGFYDIAVFQPFSNYHLALKVSYPNKSDILNAKGKNPGGDIMIHGNCVTIGCIPIQDDPIEELYVLAVEAKNQGCAIPVYIFPFKFTADFAPANAETIQFWKTLQPAFEYFETNHRLPLISVNKLGEYVLNSALR